MTTIPPGCPVLPDPERLRYLRLLAKEVPSIRSASAEIATLTARLHLPKETEHFLSDLHGQYEAFRHLLHNGSGSIRRKVEQTFGMTLSREAMRQLCTLIYYPERKLPAMLRVAPDPQEWRRTMLYQLVRVCRAVASKYTHADLRGRIPPAYAPILEELLTEQETAEDKSASYQALLDSLLDTGASDSVIITLARLIQRLAIARLHILGDIFDRGPAPHKILDTLMEHPHVDITWGNHDIVWMGAAAGSDACIANTVRFCLRYGNMEVLEQGYGISLLPLASFAMETYADDPCERFGTRWTEGTAPGSHERLMTARMHKAITILQFKLEAQILRRRPHYRMQDRLLLDKIDFERGTINLDGTTHPLLDTHLPTLDPADPYALTPAESILMEKLRASFATSTPLQRHVRMLFARGALYRRHNGNLLFHGMISMNADGTFHGFEVDGASYRGRAFMDRLDRLARQGYFAEPGSEGRQYGLDAMWYLWCGHHSPLFGKRKMATFERHFLADTSTHKEERDSYYTFREQEGTTRRILREFDLDPDRGRIINGHVPVKVRAGESPVKAGGHLLVIDGGFAQAYQTVTGIAGYTLVSNSHGLVLCAHQPFASTRQAINEDRDLESAAEVIERYPERMHVKDTDDGEAIRQRIADLRALLTAYRAGLIQEEAPGMG